MKVPQRAQLGLSLVLIAGLSGVVRATPMRNPANKGVEPWPDGTVITVYVPADPNGLGRNAALEAGILSWNGQKPLADHNIQIKVAMGSPPPNTPNSVGVNWVQSVSNSDELGEADTTGKSTGAGNTMTGATINVVQDPQQVDAQNAKNLGIHEMGHVLGLADTSHDGDAMNPNFTKANMLKIGPDDLSELGSVYAANSHDTGATVVPSATPVGGGYLYSYTATWASGGSLALFQVDTQGATISDVTAPTGWKLDDFRNGSDVTTSFQQAGPPEQFVSFINEDESSYLGPGNPSLTFSFISAGPPVAAEGFLNGRFATIGLSAVPEPSSLVLLGIGGLILLACGRRPSRAR